MKFISTRGEAPALSFEGALMAALARDGGLFMPEAWPRLEPADIAALAGLDYADAAYRVMSPYLEGDPCSADLGPVLQEAYESFHHPAVAPLRQIGPNTFVLELFHGPTLAFKDLAMQVVSRLMNRALLRKGARATVVGATSGDTGAAAIEAFRGLDAIDVFILHPKGRISDVQRRQMTTATEANVHNIAVEGTFDDCQAILKALFNAQDLRNRLALTGVNSINFARVLAQIPYYFTAGVSLGAPHRPLAFTVPTGNFGDIFAGYAARAMGLPVSRLVIATNLNDSLPRALGSGIYEPQGVVATSSPSMDIQLASNFERLLFELAGRDAARVRGLMAELRNAGAFRLREGELGRLRDLFGAHAIGEHDTEMTIRGIFEETGVLVDPHTAVGIAASRREEGIGPAPMVVLSTAHPAKFPGAVERATGRVPEQPERLRLRLGQHERCTTLPNDFGAVAEFIASHSRAVPARAEVRA
ncbi:MAG: threonine synthase [Methyloceanibacter sp.]|uniref:threonine synthase n=1 Tax=Methyloceanibacter sp. TaxID=1965321 RepID=UPI003D6C7328